MLIKKVPWYVLIVKNVYFGHPQITGVHAARQSWAMYVMLLGKVMESCVYKKNTSVIYHLSSVVTILSSCVR